MMITNIKIGNLININKDASQFYYDSADQLIKDQNLQRTFQDLGDLHNDVASNLERFVKQNGDPSIETDETIVGELSKFWGKMKARISNDTDETLVSELEEAEDRCLHSMQDLMNSDDISSETKILLQREYTALRKSHDYMKDLKDYMKAA